MLTLSARVSFSSLLVVAAGGGALAAGCFGASSLPGASAAPVPATRIAPPASGEARCAGRAVQPVNATWKVDVGGVERSFIVHVPRTYDPARPTPLVFNFHGYTMSPKLEDWLTDMAAKSDAAGFVLVYPKGTGSPSSFNAGVCCGDASRDHVDDVAFTRKMLDQLEADLCIDTRRVFATGMSNGGFMAHRLACEMSDRIAAVAPVAGVNGDPTCAPSRAVPILDFHGTADPTVPYAGDPARDWPSVPATTEAWVKRDGCSERAVETLATGEVRCMSHGECRSGAEVTLCTVNGGGHTWPGGASVPWIAGQGKTNHDVVADDLIWAFFEKHPMPEQ